MEITAKDFLHEKIDEQVERISYYQDLFEQELHSYLELIHKRKELEIGLEPLIAKHKAINIILQKLEEHNKLNHMYHEQIADVENKENPNTPREK